MWQTSIWTGAYNAMMIALSGAPPAVDPDGAWLEIWEEHLANNQPWLDTWLLDQVDGPVVARGIRSATGWGTYECRHLHHRRLARHLRLGPVLHVHEPES